MPMLTDLRESRPTRKRPLIAFHTLCLLLGLLSALFLFLSGITGPGAGYWWVRATISGTTWNMGGLGACAAGAGDTRQACSGSKPPGQWGGVMNDLRWHLAYGTMIALGGIAETTLILHRPRLARTERIALWTTFVLPLVFLPLSALTLGIDFAVLGSLKSSKTVQDVAPRPAFWLSTLSLITGALWAGLSLYLRQVAIWTASAAEDEKPPKPQSMGQKVGNAARSLWPWGTGKVDPGDDGSA